MTILQGSGKVYGVEKVPDLFVQKDRTIPGANGEQLLPEDYSPWTTEELLTFVETSAIKFFLFGSANSMG